MLSRSPGSDITVTEWQARRLHQSHLHDYGDDVVAQTEAPLHDNVSLETGELCRITTSRRRACGRDFELVRLHAELHEDIDGQDAASEQVRGDRHHESQEHSLDVHTEIQKLVPRKRKS